MAPNSGDKPEYAKRISLLRQSLGLKQIPFALELDVDQGAVSKWEQGKNRPQPDAFVKLAGLADGLEKAWFLNQAGVTDAALKGFVERDISTAGAGVALDCELLAYAILTVQESANRGGVILTTRKYAEITAKFYDRCLETGRRDPSVADDLVSRAGQPSNCKVKAVFNG